MANTDWDQFTQDTFGGLSAVPTGPSAPTNAPVDWDNFTDNVFTPLKGASDKYIAPMRGTTPSVWGARSNFLDSLLFGYGKNLAAYNPTAPDVFAGKAPNPTTRLGELTAAQEQYRRDFPRESALTEIAGGTVATIPAMWAGQEYAAAPLAARIASIAPMLGPSLDFLGGSAGAYGKGALPFILRSGSMAARGGLEGAEAGLLQSHMGQGTTGDQMLAGAETGAVLNPLLGPVASRLASNIPATAASAARSAINQGVPVRAGQLPGVSPIISTLDKVLSGAKDAPERVAWNRALSAKAGLPSDHIDQKWVENADALNGGTMGRIASTYHLDGTDPQLNADLMHLDSAAHGNLPSDAYKKFSELKARVDNELNTGAVPGAIYQNWTQKGGLISNFAKDPQLRPYVTGPGSIKEAIDNAWERSIQNSGSPTAAQDYGNWQQARSQYKVTRAIDEDVDEKTGEYNPQKLLKRVQTRFGSASRAGDVGDLATTGQYLYPPEKPPAQSSHSLISRYGPGVALVGGTLAAEGAMEHVAEPAARMIMHNPETGLFALPAIAGSYGGAKLANAWFSSQPYVKHLLDVAQGTGKPYLRGINPLIPAASDIANPRQ